MWKLVLSYEVFFRGYVFYIISLKVYVSKHLKLMDRWLLNQRILFSNSGIVESNTTENDIEKCRKMTTICDMNKTINSYREPRSNSHVARCKNAVV